MNKKFFRYFGYLELLVTLLFFIAFLVVKKDVPKAGDDKSTFLIGMEQYFNNLKLFTEDTLNTQDQHQLEMDMNLPVGM